MSPGEVTERISAPPRVLRKRGLVLVFHAGDGGVAEVLCTAAPGTGATSPSPRREPLGTAVTVNDSIS